MKRLVRSRSSGRQIYGQKWRNFEESCCNDQIEISDDGLHSPPVESTEIALVSVTQTGNTIAMLTSSGVAAPPHTVAETNGLLAPPITGEDDENQTSKGDTRRSRSHRQSMYRAALEGDWVAAEMLVEQDQSLLCDEITERGDRALHVAVAMKHKEFVQELVQRMSHSDLEILHDGHGYTACCYAAISGVVDIADVMMDKNPNLGIARDKNNMTPLQKATSRGNAKMVSYFLKSAKVEDLSKEEWFDLLLVAIRRKMYDVGLEILQMNGCIATMTNEEGTALHLLARQEILVISTGRPLPLLRPRRNYDGVMQPDVRLLAKKLWAEIQKLEEASVVELMKNPPILHDAAKARNVELITMLARAHPDLVWHTDSNGYTIFHIAVIHQHENVFNLIHQIGAMKDLTAITQDENGNNILHLAGKLTPPERRKMVPMIAFQMQREMMWFKKVEEIVPPRCVEMKNEDGHTPTEVFSEEHKRLLEESETWMRNTADSCMLISTIMLTVVFAAAFTVPGGYNGQTGIPILNSKTFWFTCFVISEATALFGSIKSMLYFWAVMTASFTENQFLLILPQRLRIGLYSLLLSLVGAISAFVSAYFLVFDEGRAATAWLVKSFIFLVYVLLLAPIFVRYYNSIFVFQLPEDLWKKLTRPGRYTLFRQQGINRKNKPRFSALPI